MNQLDEDLIKQVMQMTGLSRQEAERTLTQSLMEMTRGRAFNSDVPEKRGKRSSTAKYDENNYPRFLPSDHIQKYTIRVALKDITPTIWRKFECPSNITLRHLAELMLELMGWYNDHLNKFEVGQDCQYLPYYQYDEDWDWGDTRFQEEYRLSDLLSEKGKSIRWLYDFGDSWRHEVRLSSIAEYAEGESHDIVFKSGKRACPPEDCGGVWGYQEMLESLAKRKARKRLTSEEKEKLEWAGWDKDYEPDYLDEDDCIDTCEYFSHEEGEDTTDPSLPLDPSIAKKAQEELTRLSPLYNDVLSLSFQIRDLEPWLDLNDSHIYAIRMQDGSEIYVGTMGYGGESYDVQLFDGQESFQTYLMMVKYASLPSFELLEAHSWADYRSIMFQDPIDQVMEPAQYKMIEDWAKAHGIEIEDEHGYPFPQHFRPHHYPTMEMTDEELARMKEALEAVVWFCEQVADAEDMASLGFKRFREYPNDRGGKMVPLVVKTSEGYKLERTKLPGRMTNYQAITLQGAEIEPLRSLPKSGTMLCRLLHTPNYVGGIDDNEQAYQPLLFVCIDKKEEKPSLTKLCEMSDTFLADVLRTFTDKLMTDGILPQRITTDDARTEAILKPLCRELGIILELSRTRIPLLSDFCEFAYKPSEE